MIRFCTIVGVCLLAAGCSGKLATGYKPRPLGVSYEERRGYYAEPFTPEARAAEEQRRRESGSNTSLP